jgi:streptomycin 6-kinase
MPVVDDGAVPPVVRAKALALGAVGEAWLLGLPALVAELAATWRLEVVAPLEGGTSAYVARVRTADGEPAVLKVAVPADHVPREIATLVRAEGRGYVRLLAQDTTRAAMLLEPLGRSLPASGLDPEEQLEVVAALMPEAWRVPLPADRTDAAPFDKATALRQFVGDLWARLAVPSPAEVVSLALEYADRRAAVFDPDASAVLHGDASVANVLRVERQRPGAERGWVFVDPDGFVGDRAYDAGVALRDWAAELLTADDPVRLARRYCRLLADGTGLDEQAIWEWGFLERVSTGLYLRSLGAEDLARANLDSAALLT